MSSGRKVTDNTPTEGKTLLVKNNKLRESNEVGDSLPSPSPRIMA